MSDLQKEQVLNNLLSPNGYPRLKIDSEKSIKDREQKISTLEKMIVQFERKIEEIKMQIAEYRGDLRTLQRIRDALLLVEKETGLDGLIQMPDFHKEDHSFGEPVIEIANPEIKQRKEDGKLCMYRDFDTKKWCNKPLRSKEDKETGFCKQHREEE